MSVMNWQIEDDREGEIDMDGPLDDEGLGHSDEDLSDEIEEEGIIPEEDWIE